MRGNCWELDATMGVDVGVPVAPAPKSIVTPDLPEGLTGKVLNGPSRTERLLGGRPLSLPVKGFPEDGHADDTAGP